MSSRRVRYHSEFAADIEAHTQWLAGNRSATAILNLLEALDTFESRVGQFPAIGEEVHRRGPITYRVFGLGSLPYLVFYFYDSSGPAGPVWLAMLLHVMQDRERFDPDRF